MFNLLETMVCIQSGTMNKPGVDRVSDLIRSQVVDLGCTVEVHTQKNVGNNLVVRTPGCDALGKQILLTGHMDTVFPEKTSFNYYKTDDLNSYGPGVVDMKGGLVVGIYALKALKACSLLHRIPITFIFNSDEEKGSGTSGELIRQEARKSRAAFVLEAGGLNNEIVTGRKGSLALRLTVKGKAGHAAFAVKDKASAVLELAHKTLAVEALNNQDAGISANVGKIEGGIGPNTVSDHARAAVDFRFIDPEDGLMVREKMESIVRAATVTGTSTSLEIASGRPPMPQSEENIRLYNRVKSIADSLGIPVRPELRYGVSDANLIADENIPVVDGLGPMGGKDHSEDEYMIKSSLLQRSILLSCVLAGFAGPLK